MPASKSSASWARGRVAEPSSSHEAAGLARLAEACSWKRPRSMASWGSLSHFMAVSLASSRKSASVSTCSVSSCSTQSKSPAYFSAAPAAAALRLSLLEKVWKAVLSTSTSARGSGGHDTGAAAAGCASPGAPAPSSPSRHSQREVARPARSLRRLLGSHGAAGLAPEAAWRAVGMEWGPVLSYLASCVSWASTALCSAAAIAGCSSSILCSWAWFQDRASPLSSATAQYALAPCIPTAPRFRKLPRSYVATSWPQSSPTSFGTLVKRPTEPECTRKRSLHSPGFQRMVSYLVRPTLPQNFQGLPQRLASDVRTSWKGSKAACCDRSAW
mmetsp:Transcript_109206/g.309631  ORF Transcript_109206/g.309631 Transcript_109206/m.309631 type:complete len:329 (+) Transcript_109206:1191-2177(+)